MKEKIEELEKIKKEVTELNSSQLSIERVENHLLPVIGEGDLDAQIILIGEAPGLNEAKTGRPFVGRSGKFLDEMLQSAGIPRESVYITNIVKDRPPKNRDPKPSEIELYAPFLDRQIEAIKPKIIATLGRFSMRYILDRYGLQDKIGSIGELHGKIFETVVPWGDRIKIVPLYHPAVAIYNQGSKEALKDDFKILKTLID